MKNCYKELPAGYREAMSYDVKTARTGILMNVAAIFIAVLVYLILDFSIFGRLVVIDFFTPDKNLGDLWLQKYLVRIAVGISFFVVGFFVCVFVSQLLQAAFARLLTGEKSKVGASWSAVYVDSAKLYTTEKVTVIPLFATMAIVSIPLIIGMVLCNSSTWGLLFRTVFSAYIGAMADGYFMLILFIFVFRKGCLVKDEKTKHTFYVKSDNEQL